MEGGLRFPYKAVTDIVRQKDCKVNEKPSKEGELQLKNRQ